MLGSGYYDPYSEGRVLATWPFSECTTRSCSFLRFRLLLMKLPRDGKTAVQGCVAGKGVPISAHGDSADQNIDGSSLAPVASALVIQTRGIFVIGRVDRLVEKRLKSGPDLVVLHRFLNSGEKFLADHPDHHDASILDGLRQFHLEPLLLGGEAGSALATERGRPDGGVDEYFHDSLAMRSRCRFAL